jgi:hypothetical protein
MVELSWVYKFQEFHDEPCLSFVSQYYFGHLGTSPEKEREPSDIRPILIWVASVLEITPWKERVWGVGLFSKGGGEESTCDGG